MSEETTTKKVPRKKKVCCKAKKETSCQRHALIALHCTKTASTDCIGDWLTLDQVV